MWTDRLELLLDGLAELLRRLRNNLNWRLVRGLGQLQILTRASYLLLIVVPLLASLWPAVRIVVNQHNQAVHEAARLLRIASADLERAVDKARHQSDELVAKTSKDSTSLQRASQLLLDLQSHAMNISELGTRYATDYAERAIPTPILPWSLGAAFFAALFVVLGHLVYQLAAPEPVRLLTWDAFISSRKEDFARHPTDDALERARDYVDTRLGRRLAESDRYESEDILRRLYDRPMRDRESALRELSTERLRSLLDWLDSGKSGAPAEYRQEMLALARRILEGDQSPGPDPRGDAVQNMTTIERGDRAEYLRLAGQNPLSILLTVCLYSLAVWLIMLVIKVQAGAVVRAAGWHSLGDLLFH